MKRSRRHVKQQRRRRRRNVSGRPSIAASIAGAAKACAKVRLLELHSRAWVSWI